MLEVFAGRVFGLSTLIPFLVGLAMILVGLLRNYPAKTTHYEDALVLSGTERFEECRSLLAHTLRLEPALCSAVAKLRLPLDNRAHV